MKPARSSCQAFTLIELMIVVAIMGIVLTMGYPTLSKALHRAPLTQAVVDVTDACREARKLAILGDATAELRIFSDGRMVVGVAPADADPTAAPAAPDHPIIETEAPVPKVTSGFSAQLSDDVAVEMIDVNFTDFLGADVARVRFYPNGTCDEFTVILLCEGERRKITLEVVTSLAQVDAL